MFLTYPELKSVLYEYQLDEITESSPDIADMAVACAIEEVKSYLRPNGQSHWRDGRPRYDVATIFNATGTDRNALILGLTKSIALYYVTQLANVDILQERVQQRYDRAIDFLEKVAGVGKYADAPSIAPDLPVLSAEQMATDTQEAFRYGSRTKFNHDI